MVTLACIQVIPGTWIELQRKPKARKCRLGMAFNKALAMERSNEMA